MNRLANRNCGDFLLSVVAEMARPTYDEMVKNLEI